MLTAAIGMPVRPANIALLISATYLAPDESRVIQPTPAIVPHSAARTLPRWALLLLCLAYVVPGFIGRDPWKSADVTAFGYMRELALGHTPWLDPLMAGLSPDTDGLLPYWLGAWAIQWTSLWLSPELGARLPFAALLALTLAATWYSVYYLARSPGAQPGGVAVGGEAGIPISESDPSAEESKAFATIAAKIIEQIPASAGATATATH